MNLARAILVKVPDWSKLETEGEAAGINNRLQGVLLQKGKKKCKSWRGLWCQRRKLFKIGYVTACLMIGKRENNPTEKGANLQEQCPGAGRGDECTRRTELVSGAWTIHQVQWMDHKVVPGANSCGQGDWYWECMGILF